MSKEFLNRIMVKTAPTKVDTGVNSKPVNKETSGPLEATLYKGSRRVGQAPDTTETPDANAFCIHVTTQRLSPQVFQLAGTGRGGTANAVIAGEKAREKVAASRKSPPVAGAMNRRPNPPNTELRRFYERSDLPVVIIQGSHSKLSWKTPIDSLDFHHYLPIFVSGLREVEEPYRFVAQQGVEDMLQEGGEERVLPVIPQIILPIKDAMATRDESVVIRTLRILATLARLGPRVGQALVPYYRQILPICSLMGGKFHNTNGMTDFAQRKGHMADVISETLQALEEMGGPDAYINIKYVVPTYESATIG